MGKPGEKNKRASSFQIADIAAVFLCRSNVRDLERNTAAMSAIWKEEALSKSRTLQRYFFAGAADVEVDKQGRIVIPAKLREHAGLEKEIMIIGASSRAEIWDKERWNQNCQELTAETIEQAMEELGF